MKISLLTTVLVVATLSLAACVQSTPATHHDAAAFASQTEAGVYLTGTLASLGSFEWDAAPLLNHAANALHGAAVALKQQRIGVDEAQRRIDSADRGHDLVLKALGTCAQDNRTGKCTKDEASARALLDQARAAMSDLP
jgi:hypothetical protein